MAGKPKLALYWGASCGGCEISVVNLHEKILELDAAFDFMFCPCLLDTKRSEIEELPDGSIAVTLFNGAIRTSENEEMAHLLRRKSRLLVAFGSCAADGGIPGLANLCGIDAIVNGTYLDNPSVDNPAGILPSRSFAVPEGTLELPELYDRVKTLGEVTRVDCVVPGCPPESHRVWSAVEALARGELPPPGAVAGGGETTVCRECRRLKDDKLVARLYRSFEIVPDPERCLLEQGLLCMGIATRGGCGAPCPDANAPCSGCYGPPEGVADQGAAMVGALGSVLDIGSLKGKGAEEIAARARGILGKAPDPAGSFYKYTLAGSVPGGRGKR